MDDILAVAEAHSVKDLLDAVAGVRLAVVLARDDLLEKLAAGDQVEHHVVRAGVGERLQQAHDVRVLELPADARLSLELLQVSRRELVRANDLDGERFARLPVDAALDRAESTLAELLLEVVEAFKASHGCSVWRRGPESQSEE